MSRLQHDNNNNDAFYGIGSRQGTIDEHNIVQGAKKCDVPQEITRWLSMSAYFKSKAIIGKTFGVRDIAKCPRWTWYEKTDTPPDSENNDDNNEIKSIFHEDHIKKPLHDTATTAGGWENSQLRYQSIAIT